MDPNACLEQLCDALRNDDADEAEQSANDLLQWIRSGGAMPTVNKKQLTTLLNNLLMYVEITELNGIERTQQ